MNRLLLILVLQFSLSGYVFADEDDGLASFEKKLYTPQVLSHFGMAKDRYQSLTPEQKIDLLEAKKMLMSFFVSIQNPDSDLSEFLAQEFLERYKTKKELLFNLIDPETRILISAITDFELQQNDMIILKHYVVLFSEGDLITREDSAHFNKYESGWKIVSIGGFQQQ